MTTAWADLPNARHIDWVLASLKSDPQKWHVAWGAARGAAWAAALDAAWAAARGAARDACAALVAWHDCAHLFDLPTDAVRLLAGAGHPPAVLMLPAVIVRNGETS